MGIHDSTNTRVSPIFDELLARQPDRWLSRLVALASSQHAAFRTGELRDWRWGEDEIGLPAPRSLLKALVSRPSELMRRPDERYGTDSPTLRARRAALFAGDAAIRAEALGLLDRTRVPTRGWYVFEGETWPDIFIETDDLVLVIEGKRTESSITTKTTWMPVRHQMLRHLDAAHEIAGDRSVVGMFIVEGEFPNAREVPANWAAACAMTVDTHVLKQSLPHRSAAEREAIRAGYAGVTTWHAVIEQFELPHTLLSGIASQQTAT